MPTIKDKIRFNLDGKWSSDFKLLNVVLDNGMYEEIMVTSRTINETTIKGSTKPMLNSVEEAPRQFPMTLAFNGKFTQSDIDNVIRWLFVDYYRPLYFEGQEDRVLMVMPAEDAQIYHNGLNEGYFTITMRCDSSCVYSPVKLTNLTTIKENGTVTIQNDGHYEIYPEVSIKKVGAGNIQIKNVDDGGSIFEIHNLADGEDIYLNCEKEIIQSDIIGVYHYEDIYGEFPRIKYGINRFTVTGSCTIQFKYRLKYKF